MPQLVWTATEDGRIDYFNQGWIDYTGLTPEDTRLPGFDRAVHPDDAGEMWERWNHAIATGEPFEIEFRLRSAQDGSYRWFFAAAFAFAIGAGFVGSGRRRTSTRRNARERAYRSSCMRARCSRPRSASRTSVPNWRGWRSRVSPTGAS